MNRRDRQADIRQAEIGDADDHQVERVDRQAARVQRRKQLCPCNTSYGMPPRIRQLRSNAAFSPAICADVVPG